MGEDVALLHSARPDCTLRLFEIRPPSRSSSQRSYPASTTPSPPVSTVPLLLITCSNLRRHPHPRNRHFANDKRLRHTSSSFNLRRPSPRRRPCSYQLSHIRSTRPRFVSSLSRSSYTFPFPSSWYLDAVRSLRTLVTRPPVPLLSSSVRPAFVSALYYTSCHIYRLARRFQHPRVIYVYIPRLSSVVERFFSLPFLHSFFTFSLALHSCCMPFLCASSFSALPPSS